jgi:NDP-sugar pyrophosphorylase family protein
MKNVTLVIMAAGIGSRFGGSKQTTALGPSGESIMEYSMFDAIRAGFNHIVLIVREEMINELTHYFANKIPTHIKLEFIPQHIDSFVPTDFNTLRTKPWGTGHALLCCKTYIHGTFALINADDFYGADAINSLYEFITKHSGNEKHALVAYPIEKVLSASGPVSRGIVDISDSMHLLGIKEHKALIREQNFVKSLQDEKLQVDFKTLCSMNCWALHPEIFIKAENLFHAFLELHANDEEKEFFMPDIISAIIKENKESVKVLEGGNTWFGLTYPNDRLDVTKRINAFIEEGQYPKNLWIDFV